jgi:cation:H+ antiporter
MAASLTLVLEAALVLAVLAVTIAASQLPAGLTFARLEPGAVLIVVVWLAGLALIGGPGQRLPWQEAGQPPDGQEKARGHARKQAEKAATGRGHRTARIAATFGVAAMLTLVAGVTIEQSGEAFFGGLGLKGVVFGATVLALATALPEISTGLVAARHGDYQLAMGDIFGGNAFLPALFLLATLISGGSVLSQAKAPDIYLTALAALLTVVYLVGLVFRPKRQVAGLGWDSIAVLALYVLGVVGLTVLG